MSIFTLPLIVAMVCAAVFVKSPQQNAYFFDWQTQLFGYIQNLPVLNFFLAGALISLNAHQINNVFNRNAFYSKDTSLPGFIYVTGLATLESYDFSPLLVAHLFVVGGLAALLQLKRQEPAKNLIFLGSLAIGIAIIFSPIMISLALMPWITLTIIRPFIWRDWIVALLGLAIPVFYHYSIYFVVSGSIRIQRMDFIIDSPSVEWSIVQQITYGLMSLCVFLGLLKFIGIMRSQLVSFKKISQVILVTALLTSASFVVGWYGFNQNYVCFLIPIGFILSVQLLYSERSAFITGLVTLWFIAAIVNLYIP